MWPSLFRWLSPAGDRARLSVLIFHRVVAEPDPLFPDEMDAARFDRLCGRLARWLRVLPFEDAVRQLKAGTLPARAAAITFDDGYADNHEQALPILRRHRLPATFFVATGFLDGGRMWNDTVIEAVRRCRRSELDVSAAALPGIDRLPLADTAQRQAAIGRLIGAIKYLPTARRDQAVAAVAAAAGCALPDDLMMSSEQVRSLHRGGMRIGAHTQTHPILAGMPADAARDEIVGSKRRLESLIGEPVRVFAYPNGKPDVDYDAASVALVRDAGFEVAASTAWGAAGRDCDPLQVPRFTPWDRSLPRFGARLAGNLRRHGTLAKSLPQPAAARA